MKKILLFIVLTLCCRLLTFAQATSLTVDCQTPGWLSSMINYGDQLTVENLTITGYINNDDVKFIGSLMNNQNLRGAIDLTDVEIVPDNSLGTNAFGVSGTSGSIEIKKLLLPLSLKAAYRILPIIMRIDTLVLGGQNMHIIDRNLFELGHVTGSPYSYSYGPDIVSTFILREGVDTIADSGFEGRAVQQYTSGITTDPPVLQNVVLPSTLRHIGKRAFYQCLNITDMKLPNSVESIGEYAFWKTSIPTDTIVLPNNLRAYYVKSFNNNLNQVVYIPESVEKIVGADNLFSNSKMFKALHIANAIPPEIQQLQWWRTYQRNTPIYVPKGAKSNYTSNNQWDWATIIEEEIPAESICITPSDVIIKVGENILLTAIITPEKAEKNVRWLSSNTNIAIVNSDGVVTAKNNGVAIITATTTD